MFVVYSPDGRSTIGISQAMPPLKVDPSKPIAPTPKVELDQLYMDSEDAEKKYTAYNPAIAQYKNTLATEHQRHIVVKAKEIMTPHPITVTSSMLAMDAWALMNEKGIHHLPVIDQGLLVGLCSSRCILSQELLSDAFEFSELKNQSVANLMLTKVVTTHLEADIRKMALVMTEYNLGCLPIMSEVGDLLGIVTLFDMVKRLAEEPPIELYA